MRNSIFTLSIISIISIIALSFFVFKNADDYYFAFSQKGVNIFEYMFNRYMQWDGRSISLATFVQISAIRYLSLEGVVFIWTCCFILLSYFITKILQIELNLETLSIKNKIIATAIISITLWQGMKSIISEVVYWGVGGAYIFTTLTSIVWIFFILKKLKKEEIFFTKTLTFVFAVIAGASSMNLGTALLTFCIVIFFEKYLNNTLTKSRKIFLILSFIGVTVGLFIITIAPGNFLRAKTLGNSSTFSFNAYHLLSNFKTIIINYFSLGKTLILISIISSVFIIMVLKPLNKIKNYFKIKIPSEINFKIRNQEISTFLTNTRWLWVAISTTFPMLFINYTQANRATIFFLIFCFLFVSYFIIKLANKYFIINAGKPNLRYILVGIFFLLHIGIIGKHYKLAYNLKKEINQREIVLSVKQKTFKGKDVIIEPIKSTIPVSICFFKLSTDKNYWVNSHMARYYGFKSISIKE